MCRWLQSAKLPARRACPERSRMGPESWSADRSGCHAYARVGMSSSHQTDRAQSCHCEEAAKPALAKAGEAISTPRIGFVFVSAQRARIAHNSLSAHRLLPIRPNGNWVCFAQSPSGGASRPASPRPFPGAQAKLASFCTLRLFVEPGTDPLGGWASPSGISFNPQSTIANPQSWASGPQIGFVLHVSLPGRATADTTATFAHIPQSSQVWVRFAHFPPSAAPGRAKLGSFCAFASVRRPRPGQIGFVSHI
jgi:hypothetical protein